MKRMLNKINSFELFTKDKVVCFLLLIHNISKRLDINLINVNHLNLWSNIQSMPLVIQTPVLLSLMMVVDQIQPLVCRRYLYYYLLMNL